MLFVLFNCSFGQKYQDVRTSTFLVDFSTQRIIMKCVRSAQPTLFSSRMTETNSNYILVVYNHLTNHLKLSDLKQQVFILIKNLSVDHSSLILKA